MEDGNIEFLGRIDHQVKIRGYRIELGEIENRLLSYEGIKDAVVIDKQDPNGEKYLCAYMIPGDGFGENSDEAFAGLRSYLAAQLPDYMIPGYILTLARIPLTPNGKLDRNALPAPQSRLTGAHVPPRDEIEETLADMWRDVLDIQTPIGIDDNFFHLGGHSLKAAVLFGKIRKTFHLDFSLLELFKNPTIRDIASAIKSVEWVKQEDTDIAETENPIQNEDEEEFII
ncbi:MAG: phosphopantetheine-binding protein [Candidatus Omnitrophota bacterium]